MNKNNLHKAIGFLFIVFFTKGLWDQHFSTFPTRLLTDILSFGIPILFIYNKPQIRIPPLAWCIPLYFIIIVLSSMYNEVDNALFLTFRYYRDYFYVFLLFIVLWNAGLTIKQVHWLNKLVLALFCLQVIASLIKVFLFHQRIEGWVGLITHTGGSIATTFSIWALAYIIGFGFYNSRSLMAVGMLMPFVGYASGKRAIFFFVPLTIFCVFLSHMLMLRQGKSRLEMKRLTKQLVFVAVIFLLSLPIVTHMIETTNFGFNMYGNMGSQSVDTYLGTALSRYVSDNTYVEDGASGDRYRTTTRAIDTSISSPGIFFFGTDPFVVLNYADRDRFKKYGMYYGFTGFTTDLFSSGIFAVICSTWLMLGLFVKVLRTDSTKWSNYWKGIKLGTLTAWLAGIIIYFCYSYDFLLRPCFIVVQLYFTAILLSPKYNFSKQLPDDTHMGRTS